MRAYEFINEVFDIGEPPNVQWRTVGQGKTTTPYASWTDPTGQPIEAYYLPHPTIPDRAVVGFKRAGATGITGTAGSGAPGVFGGVMHNMRDYLERNPHINSLEFDALHDPKLKNPAKRSQLYHTMINRMAPQAGMSLADVARIKGDQEQTAKQTKDARLASRMPTLGKNPQTGNLQPQKGIDIAPTTKDRFVLSRTPAGSSDTPGSATGGGPIGSGGPVPSGAGGILRQLNPQKLM